MKTTQSDRIRETTNRLVWSLWRPWICHLWPLCPDRWRKRQYMPTRPAHLVQWRADGSRRSWISPGPDCRRTGALTVKGNLSEHQPYPNSKQNGPANDGWAVLFLGKCSMTSPLNLRKGFYRVGRFISWLIETRLRLYPLTTHKSQILEVSGYFMNMWQCNQSEGVASDGLSRPRRCFAGKCLKIFIVIDLNVSQVTPLLDHVVAVYQLACLCTVALTHSIPELVVRLMQLD